MTRFVVCIDNEGYEVDLVRGKLYEIIDDHHAVQNGMVRIVSEDGDDYLYGVNRFIEIDVPQQVVFALSSMRRNRKK